MDLAIIQRINQKRFWAKVEKTESCWNWIGNKRADGYGIFTLVIGGRAALRAHRASWVMANLRPLEKHNFICHSCDNPACVNPAHLWLGDAQLNIADCVEKGRHVAPPVKKKYTHCKHGHPATDQLSYWVTLPNGRLRRHCMPCCKANAKARKLRLKMERLKCKDLV